MVPPYCLGKRVLEGDWHRFYRIRIVLGVFGDWMVIREWGRKSSPGALRSLWFDSEEEAVAAEEPLRHSKQKWGVSAV